MDQKELARKVKLLIMDVDGTLSDGRFFMHPDGSIMKSFDVKDGTGIIFAGLAGIKTAIITGKSSEAVKKRAEELHIDDYYAGVRDKTTPFFVLLEKYELQKEEVAYIKDNFSNTKMIDIGEGIHFVQEDNPHMIGSEIAKWHLAI